MLPGTTKNRMGFPSQERTNSLPLECWDGVLGRPTADLGLKRGHRECEIIPITQEANRTRGTKPLVEAPQRIRARSGTRLSVSPNAQVSGRRPSSPAQAHPHHHLCAPPPSHRSNCSERRRGKQDRECGEASECASDTLPGKRSDAGVRSAGIQPCVPEKLANWPSGTPGTRTPTAPPPFPLGGVWVPVLTSECCSPPWPQGARLLRAETKAVVAQTRIPNGSPASLGGAPTTPILSAGGHWGWGN